MEKNNNNFQVEALEEITTDVEDCKNVRDFFSHFKIDVPNYLHDAIAAYEAALDANKNSKEQRNQDRTLLDAQNLFRISLCRAMVESDHPLFKDELFKTVINNSDQVVFTANFDKQISDALTTNKLNP